MILQLTDDAASVGIRLKARLIQAYLEDWEGLALVITPGERGHDCCHEGGSPWILHGCWPGHRTGVDLMNPAPPNAPAFYIQASGAKDGLVIFNLPERWRKTASHGRYSAAVRWQPKRVLYDPINSRVDLGLAPLPKDPGCYDYREQCGCPLPPPASCELAHFDIEYGPRCSQFIIDRVDVELENA